MSVHCVVAEKIYFSKFTYFAAWGRAQEEEKGKKNIIAMKILSLSTTKLTVFLSICIASAQERWQDLLRMTGSGKHFLAH